MPFRSRETLEAWLAEFRATHPEAPTSLRVVQQDGSEGADTGLVVVRLANAPTVTYIEPEAPGSTRWVVTMEARDASITLEADGVRTLAFDLRVVSELCAFLEKKSQRFLADRA